MRHYCQGRIGGLSLLLGGITNHDDERRDSFVIGHRPFLDYMHPARVDFEVLFTWLAEDGLDAAERRDRLRDMVARGNPLWFRHPSWGAGMVRLAPFEWVIQYNGHSLTATLTATLTAELISHTAEVASRAATPPTIPQRFTYAEPPPEPTRDPDDLARSLFDASAAAFADRWPTEPRIERWSELPEQDRQAWRTAADEVREARRQGRLNSAELADHNRMREVAERAYLRAREELDRTAAVLAERAEIERRAACAAAIDQLVAIVHVCCAAAAHGLLELDLDGRPRPARREDSGRGDDATTVRYSMLEMD